MKNICYALFFLVLASVTHAQSWQKSSTPMPGGSRDAAITFSIGNKIYSGGGGQRSNRDFYEYDIQNKIWSKKANISGVDTNRGFAAAFSINGKGYVGLGSNGIYAPSCKNDLWEYDPTSDTWLRKANYPGGNRDGIGVFVIGGKAYVGGGLDSTFNGDQHFYEYDPLTDKWTQKADLPIGPIIFPSMFSIGNFGYLTCGGGYQGEYTDLWRYDHVKDTWDQMTTFPGAARQSCATYVLKGKAYIGLGQTGYTSVFNDMYSYDPYTDSWQKEANFSGKARAWATSIAVGDTVYIGNGASFAGGFVNPMSDWWTLTPVIAAVDNSAFTEKNSVYCFPNPAANKLQIAGLTEGQNYFIRVSDLLGREVLHTSLLPQSSLDVSALQSGVYTIALGDGAKIITTKFLKE